MGINTRLEAADALTSTEYTITWTANEPTAAITTTIADGDVPTVAELGQVTADLTSIINQMNADLIELRSIINAGE